MGGPNETVPGPGHTIPGSFDVREGGSAPPPVDAPPTATIVGEPLGLAPRTSVATRKPLVIGIFAALAAIVVTAFAAYWFWWRATSPSLAIYVPKDTSYYLEIPSFPKLIVQLTGVDAFDGDELDTDDKKKELVEAFADSFDLRDAEATELIESVRSAALAMRTHDDPEEGDYRAGQSVFLLKLSDAEVTDPLFDSPRFQKDGAFAGGTKYVVYQRRRRIDTDNWEREYERRSKLSVFEAFFEDLGRPRPDKKEEESEGRERSKEEIEADEKRRARDAILVWFDEEQLLVYGDPEMVEDVGRVVRGDKGSLATDNEDFRAIDWEPNSTMIEYFDPAALGSDLKKELFDGVGAFSSSARFDDEGLVTVSRARLRGKKIAPALALVTEDARLDLYKRLPKDTFAYLAVASKLDLSGKEYVRAITKAIAEVDEKKAEEFELALEETKEKSGLGLDVAIDALGDQFVIAATASDKAASAMRDGMSDAMKHVGVVGIFALRDRDAAESLLKKMKSVAEERIGEKGTVRNVEDGFQIRFDDESKVPFQFARAEIIGDHLVVSAGGKSQIDAILEAVEKDGDLLSSDRAHKKALGVVSPGGFSGGLHAVVWADTSRIVEGLLKVSPDSRRRARKQGLPIDALLREGDDRVTSAYSLRFLRDDEDALGIELRGLNYPATFGSLWSLVAYRKIATKIEHVDHEVDTRDLEPIP